MLLSTEMIECQYVKLLKTGTYHTVDSQNSTVQLELLFKSCPRSSPWNCLRISISKNFWKPLILTLNQLSGQSFGPLVDSKMQKTVDRFTSKSAIQN